MAVKGAPATQPGVTLTVDEDRVATMVIDQPGRRVNVMNVEFIEGLERAVALLEPDLKGLIITSGKGDQFIAGADLEQVLLAPSADEAADQIRRLHRVFNRLSALPYPSVAAINGPALGGGLEVALACDYRVCVESTKNILGLPEVQLGLLPAGGGTQRLPKLIGLSRALGLILEGRTYNPKRARKYGVVDDVVHPAILQGAARGWLGKGKRAKQPRYSRLDQAAARWPLVRSIIYRQAKAAIWKKSRSHYPAPYAAFDAIRAGQEQGFGAGLAAEAVHFGRLLMGPQGRSLIHLFFATEALKKEQRGLSAEALPVDRVGVVGSGFMGAGIAQAASVAGYSTRVRDVKPEQVARGLKTANGLTMSAARKGRFSRYEAREIVSRLSGTTDYSGFARADLVIEAVFEDIAVKRQVLSELEGVVSPEAIIASNTSSLPIGDLVAQAKHPERIVGMHFFSPVHKMPLLEVIRAQQTSDRAVATAVEVGRKLGKTVIVVGDGPGFYTTRVLGFMIQEAGHLFAEGGSIEAIDGAWRRFGWPVGPLALTDEVGIDVAAHVSEILHAAFPDRYAPADAISRLVASGRLGRKTERGFYDYTLRKKEPDPDVYALRDAPLRPYSDEEITRRLMLAFVNEAARCLEEGVIASAKDGDVGSVMGLGYPPFLGGPFWTVDVWGVASIVAELQRLERQHGARFSPASLLVRLAGEGARFYTSEEKAA